MSASELHDKVRPKGAKVFELSDGACVGHAELVSKGPQTFELRATREATGTLLTCVLSYVDPTDLGWALDVWKSIRAP